MLWIHEARLLLEGGLGDGWALQLQLPFRAVQARTRFTDLNDVPIVPAQNIHHPNGTFSSPGDALLLLHTARGGLRGGVSLPFGAVQQDPYALGEAGLPHQHLQFGTGTVDPYIAAELRSGAFAAYAQAQVPLYEGPTGYRAGARGTAGASVSHLVGPVMLRLAATVSHEEEEHWHGAVPTEDGNQGRTDLFVAPGATFRIGEWELNVDVLARAWGHTVNAQLDMPLVVQLGVGRLLHAEQD